MASENPKKWSPRNYFVNDEVSNEASTEVSNGFITKEDRKKLQTGSGDRVIKQDSVDGWWAGNSVFKYAGFSVDLMGNIISKILATFNGTVTFNGAARFDGDVAFYKYSRIFGYPSGTQQTSTLPAFLNIGAKLYDPTSEFDIATKLGTSTFTLANHLVDANASFVAADVGKMIMNTTDSTSAVITNIDTPTDVTLDADIMASGENYTMATGRFTAVQDGYYHVKAQVTYANSLGTPVNHTIRIIKNASTIMSESVQQSQDGTIETHTVSCIVILTAGQYLRIQVQNSVASLITADLYQTNVCIHRI
jgi:hypothetical protein